MPPVETPVPDEIHVLVTGFGPFENYPVNPSWQAVKALTNTVLTVPTAPKPGNEASSPAGTRQIYITTLEVPTVYDAILERMPGLHATPPVLPRPGPTSPAPAHLPHRAFDFILHVGVGRRGAFRVERRGHKYGYNRPDAEGRLAPVVPGTDGPVRGFGVGYEKMPEELLTVVDVEGVSRSLRETGVESEVSDDAGHYCCDFIYYASLAQAKRNAEEGGKMTPVQFLHCSPLNEPYSTEQVTEAIKHILTWVGSRL